MVVATYTDDVSTTGADHVYDEHDLGHNGQYVVTEATGDGSVMLRDPFKPNERCLFSEDEFRTAPCCTRPRDALLDRASGKLCPAPPPQEFT